MSATLLIRSSGSTRGGWALGGGRFGGNVGTGVGTGADTAFAAFCLATANFLNATNYYAASTALSASVIGLSA
jgi:hypothetical protein